VGRVIYGAGHAHLAGAMSAAEHPIFGFYSMADYATPAVRAGGGEAVDRALKTVEHVALAPGDDFKRAVVVVTANFTASHDYLHYRDR
jgi:hypothetical protein